MDVLSEVLERYGGRTVAGILARAAIQVETGQDYKNSIIQNERDLRSALIIDARAKLGLNPDDNGPEVIDKIGSLLDDESDRISDAPDEKSAIDRLIARGDLPSDLYEIEVVRNTRDFFGEKYPRERELIERTVRAPSREQHFKISEDLNVPSMVSLFAREFRTPYPARNFTMLVAGQRGKGRRLDVHSAWRLYPSHVNVEGAADLVELLRRFAEEYGVDITLDGQKGRFFFTTTKSIPRTVNISLPGHKSKQRTAMITRFFQHVVRRSPQGSTTQEASSLVMAIDLDRYRKTLENFDCKDIF